MEVDYYLQSRWQWKRQEMSERANATIEKTIDSEANTAVAINLCNLFKILKINNMKLLLLSYYKLTRALLVDKDVCSLL